MPIPCRRGRSLLIIRILSRVWIPLVILAVVAVGGFTVSRIHGFFGSQQRPSYADGKMEETKPFDPKRLTYEIFGPPGTIADISYFDTDAEPQRVDGATIPWRVDLTTTAASVMGNIVAQGDSDMLGCRIIVDDEVRDERVSNEVSAFTFCLVKGA